MVKRLAVYACVLVLAAGLLLAAWQRAGQGPSATPLVETVAMRGAGDVADDVCLWVHPKDASRSVIIGTNKSTSSAGGLYAFRLDGARCDGAREWVAGKNRFDAGECVNNVDVRYGFPAGEEAWDIVCASNRSRRAIDVLRVTTGPGGDFAGLELVGRIAVGGKAAGNPVPYGLAMYHSRRLGRYFAIVSDIPGRIWQVELVHKAGGKGSDRITGKLLGGKDAPWRICPGQVEGIVADDENDVVYIAGEDKGIFRFQTANGTLDPRKSTTVDTTGGERLVADVEGLTLYYGPKGQGYLIASVQGASRFAVYSRRFDAGKPNDYVMSFHVGRGRGIDAVTETDGIDVTNLNLGGRFAGGMFLAHDGQGDNPSNFKLVSWAEIARLGGHELLIDTAWSPRPAPTDPNAR